MDLFFEWSFKFLCVNWQYQNEGLIFYMISFLSINFPSCPKTSPVVLNLFWKLCLLLSSEDFELYHNGIKWTLGLLCIEIVVCNSIPPITTFSQNWFFTFLKIFSAYLSPNIGIKSNLYNVLEMLPNLNIVTVLSWKLKGFIKYYQVGHFQTLEAFHKKSLKILSKLSTVSQSRLGRDSRICVYFEINKILITGTFP